jgi:outer membrane protein TolC
MKHFALPLFAMIMLVATASSQPAPPRRLTIDDAVRLAMEKNSDLHSARLDVDRADARVQEAFGYALPSIDFSSRYVRTLKKPVFFFPDIFSSPPRPERTVTIAIGSNYSLDASFTARQILFNGTVFAGMGAASIYSSAAREVYRSKQLETVTNVKKAFFQTLLAKDALELMRSSLYNAESNLKNVNLLRQQGLLSEYDQLRATVAVENLRPAVIQSETNATLAIENLKATVGVDPSETIEPIGMMEYVPMDDSLIAAAPSMLLDSNPSYAAVEKQVEVGKAFVLAERANYLPTIAAFGNYQFQAAKNSSNMSTNDLINSSQIGLTVTMNLFQGLQTNARVQQAQVDVRKGEEQRTSVERNLKIGLTSVIGNIRAARQRFEAQARTIEQAERGYKIVTTRFLSGAATQLEVNDAELALTQTKVNRIQALYDYLVASAELDRILGRLPASVPPTDLD